MRRAYVLRNTLSMISLLSGASLAQLGQQEVVNLSAELRYGRLRSSRICNSLDLEHEEVRFYFYLRPTLT